MRMKIVHETLRVIQVALAAVIAVPLCGCQTGISGMHRDIDINTGDVRQRAFLLGLPAGTHVTESPFSREVRRLHIPCPEGRVWKPMTVSSAGRVDSQEYSGAIEDCNFLLQWLNLLRVPDEERVTILTRALSNLQKGELDDTYDLIGEMANRARIMQGMPPVPKQERMPWRIDGKRIQM